MNSKSKQHSFLTVFVCGHKDTTIFEIQKIIIYLLIISYEKSVIYWK